MEGQLVRGGRGISRIEGVKKSREGELSRGGRGNYCIGGIARLLIFCGKLIKTKFIIINVYLMIK